MSPSGVRVAFELERFEVSGGDRLEVSGRWFGVRGLRFVRPSLTIQTDDGQRSVLALLEHKPWAAEEGESWVAAFPWDGDSPDPGQTELAVAPSVVVALVPDGEEMAVAAPRGPDVHDRLRKAQEQARRLESEVAWLREEREGLIAEKRSARDERADLEEELAVSRGELEAARQAGVEAAAIREERDRAVAALEKATRERDAAVAERDAAQAARDQALHEVVTAQHDREQSERARHGLAAERDEAARQAKAALAERDAALGRGSGFPAVSAADLARQPYESADAPPQSVDWLPRALALGALVVALILLVVFLRVI